MGGYRGRAFRCGLGRLGLIVGLVLRLLVRGGLGG